MDRHLYLLGLPLRMRIRWISLAAWFARYDVLVTARIAPLDYSDCHAEIPATIHNRPHWSRGIAIFWTWRWSGSMIESVNHKSRVAQLYQGRLDILRRVFVSEDGVTLGVVFAPLDEPSGKPPSPGWVEVSGKWLRIDCGLGSRFEAFSLGWAPAGCERTGPIGGEATGRSGFVWDGRTRGVILTCVGNWPLHHC